MNFDEYKNGVVVKNFAQMTEDERNMMPDWAASFNSLAVFPDSRAAGIVHGEHGVLDFKDLEGLEFYFVDGRSTYLTDWNRTTENFYRYYLEEDFMPELTRVLNARKNYNAEWMECSLSVWTINDEPVSDGIMSQIRKEAWRRCFEGLTIWPNNVFDFDYLEGTRTINCRASFQADNNWAK